MGKFFRKLERSLVNIIVICLVLIISSQLIMKNDTTWQRFQDLKFTFQKLFIPEKEVIQVNTLENKEQGVVVIHLIPDLSLPQVWILKNGEKEANFSNGYTVINVNEGDLLTIDSRYYEEELYYKITSLTSTINSIELGDILRTSGDTTSLGIIKFNNKL